MRAAGKPLPRVLITGFEPFPGAPVNPTQELVQHYLANPPELDGIAAFRAELLPVDYVSIAARLEEIGRDYAPDIAIHFGLAAGCLGFRLERIARNQFSNARPDNRGHAPADGPICRAGPHLNPTLPLVRIHEALMVAKLPVEWSDDAGGYLCNMAMTLSLAGACEGFAPAMSGFVHVPLVGEGARLTMEQLIRGANLICASCVDAWRSWPPSRGLQDALE